MKPILHVLSAGAIAASLCLCACESTEVSKISSHAEQVASGTGDTTYRTADAETLFIYDKTWNKLVYTGDVKPDQLVKVEPENSRVLIDGRPVVEQTPLGGGDRFDIYLDNTTAASSTRTIERRTVIERETNE